MSRAERVECGFSRMQAVHRTARSVEPVDVQMHMGFIEVNYRHGELTSGIFQTPRLEA